MRIFARKILALMFICFLFVGGLPARSALSPIIEDVNLTEANCDDFKTTSGSTNMMGALPEAIDFHLTVLRLKPLRKGRVKVVGGVVTNEGGTVTDPETGSTVSLNFRRTTNLRTRMQVVNTNRFLEHIRRLLIIADKSGPLTFNISRSQDPNTLPKADRDDIAAGNFFWTSSVSFAEAQGESNNLAGDICKFTRADLTFAEGASAAGAKMRFNTDKPVVIDVEGYEVDFEAAFNVEAGKLYALDIVDSAGISTKFSSDGVVVVEDYEVFLGRKKRKSKLGPIESFPPFDDLNDPLPDPSTGDDPDPDPPDPIPNPT